MHTQSIESPRCAPVSPTVWKVLTGALVGIGLLVAMLTLQSCSKAEAGPNGGDVVPLNNGQAKAEIGGKQYRLEAGDAIVVPRGLDFTLSNDSKTAFIAIAVLPVGGQAIIAGEQPFTPPWAA